MARQFNRIYELTIIPPNGESRVIRNLRINFEITKSVLSYPNLAKVVLYNLNDDSLAALQTKFTKVILNAGYKGNIRLLFKGDVRNVFQVKNGVDRVVTFYAGDSERSWQNANFNKTFTDSATVQSVVKDVISSFKDIAVGVVEGLPNIADKLSGQSLSGSSKDVMDNLASEYGFNWSIDDGEINVVPIETPIRVDQAVLVNSATGMIGSPTITEIGADVTTLLNPIMMPNTAFKIESLGSEVQLGNLFFRNVKRTSAEGLYKIQEVIFKGDSREGEWTSSVKGRSL